MWTPFSGPKGVQLREVRLYFRYEKGMGIFAVLNYGFICPSQSFLNPITLLVHFVLQKARVKHQQLWATMYCFMIQKYSIAGCVMIVEFQLYAIFVMISSLKGKAMR